MPYEVIISKTATKEINALPLKTKINVIQHIQALAEEPSPRGCKKMAGHEHLWRIRVGTYCIIYGVVDNILCVEVVRVRHRKEVYE
jgi:mRNA interferase RelE/StbE